MMTDASDPDTREPRPAAAPPPGVSPWVSPLRAAPRRIQIARIGYDIVLSAVAFIVAFVGHPWLASLVSAALIVATGLILWRPYTTTMPRTITSAIQHAVVGGLGWILGIGVTAFTQWAAAAGAPAGLRGVGYLTAVAGGAFGGAGTYALLRYAVRPRTAPDPSTPARDAPPSP